MLKLTKSKFLAFLDTILIKSDNIPTDLMDKYKEKLAEVYLDIQKKTAETFKDNKNADDEVVKFFEHPNESNNYEMISKDFMLINLPIIVPVEVFAMCLLLTDKLLPASMVGMSQGFVNSVVNLIMSSFSSYFNAEKAEKMYLEIMKRVDFSNVN